MRKAILVLSTLFASMAFSIPLYASTVIYLPYGTALTNVGSSNPLYGATTTAQKSVAAGTTVYQVYCANVNNGNNPALLAAGVYTSFGVGNYVLEPDYAISGVNAQYCSHYSTVLSSPIVAGQPYFVQWNVNGVWVSMTTSLSAASSNFYALTDDPTGLVFDINATSTSGLYGGLNFASSSISCSTGNIFTDGFCTAISYLFVPSPDILNQYAGFISTSSPTSISNHIPFSYFYDTVSVLTSAQASTTQMVTWTIPFHSLGMGSTTAFGNFLPDVTILSSSTITYWIGLDRWNQLQILLIAVLYLTMAYEFYRQARWLAAKHH